MKSEKNKDAHYVNNKEFSLAVLDYVNLVEEAKKNEKPIPKVTNYIGDCFLKISTGLSNKGNFSGYTYKDEMVMDAVENCLRAVTNYDINAATRTGDPNAFSYFTQICYYAFLRRIAKEKQQQAIKMEYRKKCGIGDMIEFNEDDADMADSSYAIVDNIRFNNESDYEKDLDSSVSVVQKREKKEKERQKRNLENFMK